MQLRAQPIYHATSGQPQPWAERSLGMARSAAQYLDPLDEDRPTDPVVIMTERQLIRLLFVASDTAVRFDREEIDYDPLAWMFCPRALFSGEAAVEACRDRQNFVRSTLLHGLSFGLDADPEDIEALLRDDDDVIELATTSVVEDVPAFASA